MNSPSEMHYVVNLRQTCGTYLASTSGLRASASIGPEEAAKRVVLKQLARDYGRHGRYALDVTIAWDDCTRGAASVTARRIVAEPAGGVR